MRRNLQLPPDIRQAEREPDRFEGLDDQGAVEECDRLREERGGRPSSNGRIARDGLIGAASRADSEPAEHAQKWNGGGSSLRRMGKRRQTRGRGRTTAPQNRIVYGRGGLRD